MNNFSGKAMLAIDLSRDAARQLGHGYIGTEHLLLGLARCEGSVAASVLDKNDLSADFISDTIAEIIGLKKSSVKVYTKPSVLDSGPSAPNTYSSPCSVKQTARALR